MSKLNTTKNRGERKCSERENSYSSTIKIAHVLKVEYCCHFQYNMSDISCPTPSPLTPSQTTPPIDFSTTGQYIYVDRLQIWVNSVIVCFSFYYIYIMAVDSIDTHRIAGRMATEHASLLRMKVCSSLCQVKQKTDYKLWKEILNSDGEQFHQYQQVGSCCFSVKNAALRSRSKDWSSRKWSGMSKE